MELGLQFEDIMCYETTAEITAAHEESLETMIPEYCPDVTRIVDVVGRLSIREKLLNDGKCTVSGHVKVVILYTSEETAGLRSLNLSVPFSCLLEEHGLANCRFFYADGRILLAEARTLSARKLYIRVLPEITVTGYRQVKRRVCRGTDRDPTVRTKCLQAEINALTAISEKGFHFTQGIAPDGDFTAEDILLYRLCPGVLSKQRLGNKLMIKGEMWVSILYRDGTQSLRQYNGTLPFSQILDVAELPENAEYTIRPQAGESDVRILKTDAGSGFGVTAHVDVCLMAYQRITTQYVTDIYSTRYDTAVEQQELVLPLAAPEQYFTQEETLRLEFEGKQPFITVTSVECSPVEAVQEGERVSLRTALHVRILYLDEAGAPVSTERTAEVCAAIAAFSGAASAACCQAELQFSGSICQVGIPVCFCVRYTGEKRICGITSVVMTDPEPVDAPSLILCRMAQGETLWEIAKRFHTDETMIRAANQLESGVEAADGMLLIPRIR